MDEESDYLPDLNKGLRVEDKWWDSAVNVLARKRGIEDTKKSIDGFFDDFTPEAVKKHKGMFIDYGKRYSTETKLMEYYSQKMEEKIQAPT